MPILNVRGLEVFYHDEGSGAPVILCHCSSASHKEWFPLMSRLRGGYRILAPDLIGYGKSARWPAGRFFDGSEDFEIIKTLASLSQEPAHIVGHSYGAAAALGAALSLGKSVRSIALIEPVAFQLLNRQGYEQDWQTVTQLAQRVLRHMAAGKRRQAAAAYMGFWLGPLRWFFTPPKVKRSVYETMEKAAAEFGLIETIRTDASEISAMGAPVRLIYGEKTRAPAKSVIAILKAGLPDAEVRMIPKAGHMSPFTHAEDVNRLITQHIARH